MSEIIDIVEVGIPGPIGDVTPAALQAVEDARAEADRAEDARDQAEVFSATSEVLQQKAVTQIQSAAPLPLSGVTTRLIDGSEPIPVAFWGGKLYGVRSSTIASSEDSGTTWTTLTTAATMMGGRGGVIDMEPTNDGEVIVLTPRAIFKSSGWGTESISFTEKVVTNTANSPFQPWSLDGDGTRFIAAEYNVGGTGFWGDSRYAHVSYDDGDTWAIAYDTLAIHGATQNNQSHLHGVAVDTVAGCFFLVEGHGPAAGIYTMPFGGSAWTRTTITDNVPAHTAIVSTPHGLVSASDTTLGGTYGAPRATDPALMRDQRTWAWQPGHDGTLGFGVRGEYDSETGLTFFGYRVETANTAPFIAASSISAGAMVYEWPDGFALLGDVRGVWPVGGGNLVAVVSPDNSATERYLVTATIPRPGAALLDDKGQVFGGVVGRGNSVAVGPRATTGASVRSFAGGVNATVEGVQDSVAVGAATNAKSFATVVGAYATGDAQTVAVGESAKAVAAGSVAVGAKAETTASAATAIGEKAKAGNAGVAVGQNSESVGFSVAVGRTAKALHGSSVVLGSGLSSTAANQVKYGQAHFEGGATSPSAPGADLGRWFFRKNTNGKMELAARFPTKDVQVIASETGARPIPAYTSGNRPAAADASPGTSSAGMIFDRTLQKPLWSDGTNWRDAAGTVV